MKRRSAFTIGNRYKQAVITTVSLLVTLGSFTTVPAQQGIAKAASLQTRRAADSALASPVAAKRTHSFEPNVVKPNKYQSGQSQAKPTFDESKSHTIRVYDHQLVKKQANSPADNSLLRVINHAGSEADIDLVAVDLDGKEVARETVTAPPNQTVQISFQETFPDLTLSNLSVVEIQAAARPVSTGRMDTLGLRSSQAIAQGFLAVAFFSQRDPQWKDNQLGTCVNTTIGSDGCAITTIAMAGARSVINWNPATVNNYLTNNNGYASGCLLKWASPANIDGLGGFTHIGSGSVSSAANLKALIDSSKFAVAKSFRFSSHFAIIIGYNGDGSKLSDFVYLDPWDLSATFRTVGDGWVTATSTIQIYK